MLLEGREKSGPPLGWTDSDRVYGLYVSEFSSIEKEIHLSCAGQWTRNGVMDVSSPRAVLVSLPFPPSHLAKREIFHLRLRGKHF
jgi:hypothetical protein